MSATAVVPTNVEPIAVSRSIALVSIAGTGHVVRNPRHDTLPPATNRMNIGELPISV